MCGKNVEQMEVSYIAGGHVGWYNHSEKWFKMTYQSCPTFVLMDKDPTMIFPSAQYN